MLITDTLNSLSEPRYGHLPLHLHRFLCRHLADRDAAVCLRQLFTRVFCDRSTFFFFFILSRAVIPLSVSCYGVHRLVPAGDGNGIALLALVCDTQQKRLASDFFLLTSSL